MGSLASSGYFRWAVALSWISTPGSLAKCFLCFSPFGGLFAQALLLFVHMNSLLKITPKFSHDSEYSWPSP